MSYYLKSGNLPPTPAIKSSSKIKFSRGKGHGVFPPVHQSLGAPPQNTNAKFIYYVSFQR